MNKIVSFLSTYEEELQLQVEFLNKSILRLESQIKESKKSIREAKKNIDASYNMFSASQSNNEVETEISTLNVIIDDKNKQIEDLKKRKDDISRKLDEIKNLGYQNLETEIHNNDFNIDIIDKLRMTRKFMDVDVHRAKIEIDKIITRLENKGDM